MSCKKLIAYFHSGKPLCVRQIITIFSVRSSLSARNIFTRKKGSAPKYLHVEEEKRGKSED